MMHSAKTWTVSVYLDEEDGRTRARARLTNRDRELTGAGEARCRPTDIDVPEIGDELAIARALVELAHQLFEAAAGDIEARTGNHVPFIAP